MHRRWVGTHRLLRAPCLQTPTGPRAAPHAPPTVLGSPMPPSTASRRLGSTDAATTRRSITVDGPAHRLLRWAPQASSERPNAADVRADRARCLQSSTGPRAAPHTPRTVISSPIDPAHKLAQRVFLADPSTPAPKGGPVEDLGRGNLRRRLGGRWHRAIAGADTPRSATSRSGSAIVAADATDAFWGYRAPCSLLICESLPLRALCGSTGGQP